MIKVFTLLFFCFVGICSFANGDVFTDYFDIYNAGWPAGEWERGGDGLLGYAWTVEVDDNTYVSYPHSLLIKQVGNHWQGVKASHSIPVIDWGQLEFSIKSSSSSDTGLRVILYSGSKLAGYICLGSNGRVFANTTWDTVRQIGTYSAETWYPIKIEWKGQEASLDISFNGNPVDTFDFFDYTASSIDTIVISLNNGSTNYSGWIDDISISALPGDPQECGDDGTVYLKGDLNEDCEINMVDFSEIANNWLEIGMQ